LGRRQQTKVGEMDDNMEVSGALRIKELRRRQQ